MKLCFIVFTIIPLISCNGSSQRIVQQKELDQNWRVAEIITQKHSYNKIGLLDTTLRTEDIYVNGVSGVIMNSIIKREYDERNNKIVERTFQVLKKKNKLSEEKLYEYDGNNNLVLMTEKFEDVVGEITKNTYDSKHQKTQEISINKKFEEHPNRWNLDSALAHYNDKKTPRYDTLIISYKYDKKGNLINLLYRSPGDEIGETVTTLYSGKQKILTFSITSKGDTASKVNYVKNGNLTTENEDNLLYTDTSLYDGDKLIQKVSIAKTSNFNSKETFKYDEKGNLIEDVKYK